MDFVVRAMALGELAVDVFDHDDRAVDDDAEVDSADGEQVGGFAGSVKKDEGEEKSERNGQCGDDGSAEADEEKDQHKENEHHAAERDCVRRCRWSRERDRCGRSRDELLRRGEECSRLISIGFLFDALKDVLRLFAATHEDDAFDGVVVVFRFVLEAENAKARRVADHYACRRLSRARGRRCRCQRRLRRCLPLS